MSRLKLKIKTFKIRLAREVISLAWKLRWFEKHDFLKLDKQIFYKIFQF